MFFASAGTKSGTARSRPKPPGLTKLQRLVITNAPVDAPNAEAENGVDDLEDSDDDGDGTDDVAEDDSGGDE